MTKNEPSEQKRRVGLLERVLDRVDIGGRVESLAGRTGRAFGRVSGAVTQVGQGIRGSAEALREGFKPPKKKG